jgi:hypothetical protein
VSPRWRLNPRNGRSWRVRFPGPNRPGGVVRQRRPKRRSNSLDVSPKPRAFSKRRRSGRAITRVATGRVFSLALIGLGQRKAQGGAENRCLLLPDFNFSPRSKNSALHLVRRRDESGDPPTIAYVSCSHLKRKGPDKYGPLRARFTTLGQRGLTVRARARRVLPERSAFPITRLPHLGALGGRRHFESTLSYIGF